MQALRDVTVPATQQRTRYCQQRTRCCQPRRQVCAGAMRARRGKAASSATAHRGTSSLDPRPDLPGPSTLPHLLNETSVDALPPRPRHNTPVRAQDQLTRPPPHLHGFLLRAFLPVRQWYGCKALEDRPRTLALFGGQVCAAWRVQRPVFRELPALRTGSQGCRKQVSRSKAKVPISGVPTLLSAPSDSTLGHMLRKSAVPPPARDGHPLSWRVGQDWASPPSRGEFRCRRPVGMSAEVELFTFLSTRRVHAFRA